MTRAAPVALACLAAVLVWILYQESGAQPEAAPVAGPAVRPAVVPPAAASPRPDQTANLMTAILDRPLFSPTRRPPAAAPAAVARKEAAAATPRLAGVLVSAGGRGAIFAQPGEKPVLAREGDRVGPYLVQSISAGQVTVVGPRGLSVLHPAFADATGGGATQAATPAPAAMSLLDKLRTEPPPPAPPVPTTEMLLEVFKRQRTEPPK